MSKKISIKKPLLISGKEAEKALSIGLAKYMEMTGNKNKLSEYAGVLEFDDDEFEAMLQELEEDK